MVNLDAARTRSSPRGSYEEYHPYGSTAWWAGSSGLVSQKRYRFTGMERDEETGLQCHGVRYYAVWLGRWVSADPIGLGDGVNRYGYCHGGVVGGRDTTGLVTLEVPPRGDTPILFTDYQIAEFWTNRGQRPPVTTADANYAPSKFKVSVVATPVAGRPNTFTASVTVTWDPNDAPILAPTYVPGLDANEEATYGMDHTGGSLLEGEKLHAASWRANVSQATVDAVLNGTQQVRGRGADQGPRVAKADFSGDTATFAPLPLPAEYTVANVTDPVRAGATIQAHLQRTLGTYLDETFARMDEVENHLPGY